MDKYKINYHLSLLNYPQYKKALRLIPKALGITKLTFYHYRKVQVGDRYDIPYEKVKMLEIILDATEGLENYAIKAKSLADMKDDS
jgi:hypothetical protein